MWVVKSFLEVCGHSEVVCWLCLSWIFCLHGTDLFVKIANVSQMAGHIFTFRLCKFYSLGLWCQMKVSWNPPKYVVQSGSVLEGSVSKPLSDALCHAFMPLSFILYIKNTCVHASKLHVHQNYMWISFYIFNNFWDCYAVTLTHKYLTC